MGTAYAVKMENVTKRFGKVVANNAINLELHEGEILSLLGENGSGKTTLIKISAGLLTADSGTVCIDKAPVGVYTKAITSYLPDRMALPTEFTAADAVSLYTDFFADFDRTKANAMLAKSVAPSLPEELKESKAGSVIAKVVTGANALLQGTAMLTLADETREMEGGLILRDGNVEVNCAFETQLRVLRETMAADVAAILFA